MGNKKFTSIIFQKLKKLLLDINGKFITKNFNIKTKIIFPVKRI